MRDSKRTLTSIIIIVVVLSHGTDGGSWKNLERKFIQNHEISRHWDENRIRFPDEDGRQPSWHPDRRPQDEYSPQYPQYDATTTTTSTTTSAPFTSTTRNLAVESCIRECPSTPEYNPVCGTNFVTYNNIGKLECEKYCGVDVQFWRHSRCPTVTPTTSAPTTTQRSDYEIQYCIDTCPVTSQYDPVCGTNEVTYTNIGKLECAKACGVDVNFKRQLPCSAAIVSTESPDFGSPESSSSEEDYGGDFDVRYPGPMARRRFCN